MELTAGMHISWTDLPVGTYFYYIGGCSEVSRRLKFDEDNYHLESESGRTWSYAWSEILNFKSDVVGIADEQ